MDEQQAPDIIKSIRMLREVRGLSFQQAKTETVRLFDSKGWPVPKSIRSLCNLHSNRHNERDTFRGTL